MNKKSGGAIATKVEQLGGAIAMTI